MNRFDLRLGDSLELLKTLPDNSVDAVVTDQPAGIAFMGKAWDGDKGGKRQWKAWMQSIAVECLRVMKPGGYAYVWALPRTSHWTADAWEDAGWFVAHQSLYCFGSGFPKGLNVGRKLEGWDGWNTAIKPAHEIWWLLQKPISEKTIVDNVLRWGVGALNIGACRVVATAEQNNFDIKRIGYNNGCNHIGQKKDGQYNTYSKLPSGEFQPMQYVKNGRYPSTLLFDGSDEVKACFPETLSGFRPNCLGKVYEKGEYNTYGKYNVGILSSHPDSGGNATRFFSELTFDAEDLELCERLFYCGKISPRDRNEGCEKVKNTHPTVKATELMRWLIRLITPPDGTVLDPFMGSGSTGKAAAIELKSFIGFDYDPDYFEIAKARVEWAQANRETYAKKQPNAAPLPTSNYYESATIKQAKLF